MALVFRFLTESPFGTRPNPLRTTRATPPSVVRRRPCPARARARARARPAIIRRARPSPSPSSRLAPRRLTYRSFLLRIDRRHGPAASTAAPSLQEVPSRTLHGLQQASFIASKKDLFVHLFSSLALPIHVISLQQSCHFWRFSCICNPSTAADILSSLTAAKKCKMCCVIFAQSCFRRSQFRLLTLPCHLLIFSFSVLTYRRLPQETLACFSAAWVFSLWFLVWVCRRCSLRLFFLILTQRSSPLFVIPIFSTRHSLQKDSTHCLRSV